MTNTNQEVTVSSEEEAGKMSTLMIVEEKRMPRGASFEEAPAVHCGITFPDGSRNSGHTSPSSSSSEVYQQQEEQCTEEELVVAVGNAAKAARRVAIHQYQKQKQQQNRLRTLTTVKETDDNTDTIDGVMERHASACVNGYTDYENGEVCNTNPITATLTASTTSANEKKNEICTWNATNAGISTTTTKTTSNTGAVVVDDEDDYVVGNYGEEEDRAYKTSGAATLSQSEHIIQQQQQQQEQGINALISNIGLFLDQTWNWLHYFLVTIIFLNLVHFADRREPVVGEARSVEVEGAPREEEEEKNQVENNNFIDDDEEKVCEGESSLESEESGKIVNTEENLTESVENNSTLLENSTEIIMSPNTCSIQNQQEVEKAEEAIMAVPEKVEAVAAATPEAPVVEAKSEIAVEKKEEVLEQQITVVVPSADQVVVVSGVDSDDNSDKDSGLDGLRRDSVDSYTSEGSGNLGDNEGDIGDKSSEDGSSICNDTGAEAEGGDGKQTAQKIIAQVESMFSDDHLAKDGFLLKHVRRRSDGFVSLKLVAGLRKVKQISRDFPVVLNALKDSSKLEINSEGTKVRRVEPLTPFLKSVPIKSKDKDKEGNGKDGSSNDENQHPTASIQQNNK